MDAPVHEHTGQCVIVLPPDEALPHARRYARQTIRPGTTQATPWLDEAWIFMDHDEAGATLASLRASGSAAWRDARVAFLLLEVRP